MFLGINFVLRADWGTLEKQNPVPAEPYGTISVFVTQMYLNVFRIFVHLFFLIYQPKLGLHAKMSTTRVSNFHLCNVEHTTLTLS